MLKSHISFSKMCLVKKRVGYFLYKKKFYKISFSLSWKRKLQARIQFSSILQNKNQKQHPCPHQNIHCDQIVHYMALGN